MEVHLSINIGNDERPAFATKTIELEFTPVSGMMYNDGTWKGGDGMTIREVRIECEPGRKPYLAAFLGRDNSESADVLTPMYKSWDWDVTG